MTRWRKQGLVIRPDPSIEWQQTHAMVPTPEHISGSLWKIYWASRNSNNHSHIGWSLINLDDPTAVLESAIEPVLTPGELGCFDDSGVLPSCIIQNGDETLLYYIGFKPGGTTRMDLYGGLARRGKGDDAFKRVSRAPILERCAVNPLINTAPWVVRNGEDWRMYYVAGTEWVHADLPRYRIEMASSADGYHWQRKGDIAIDYAPGENALARPYVYHDGEQWVMWFASKGEEYRPKLATSPDGVNWTRSPEGTGLEPSAEGPDSIMLEYGAVLIHHGRRLVFYNGNDYGNDGICLAVED